MVASLGSIVYFILALDKFVKSGMGMKSVISDLSELSVVSDLKNLVSKYL